MANNAVLVRVGVRVGRAGRAAAAGAVLIALVAGCSGGSGTPTATPTSGSVPGSATGTPGRLTAQANGVNLTISDAVARTGSSGTGELTMTVRNDGDVPEHLAMVAVPGAGRATLQGMATGNGSLSTAGILIAPHSTVTFGGNGPRVLLPARHGATAGGVVTLTMQFGVVGLVHLPVRQVTS